MLNAKIICQALVVINAVGSKGLIHTVLIAVMVREKRNDPIPSQVCWPISTREMRHDDWICESKTFIESTALYITEQEIATCAMVGVVTQRLSDFIVK